MAAAVTVAVMAEASTAEAMVAGITVVAIVAVITADIAVAGAMVIMAIAIVAGSAVGTGIAGPAITPGSEGFDIQALRS
jgi:hypothetical protein